jgi:hypothetical protein
VPPPSRRSFGRPPVYPVARRPVRR